MHRASLAAAVLGLLACMAAPASGQAPAPLGPEFRVNASTLGDQFTPSVSAAGNGGFVVVWRTGSPADIFGQRYDAAGAPRGGEFQVSPVGAAGPLLSPGVAADADGDFVVVWSGFVVGGSGQDVFGQRFASSGTPRGGEFQVNTYTNNYQYSPTLAMEPDGDFVVVWASNIQESGSSGIYAQRFASSGARRGAEFHVNTYTTGAQVAAAVAADAGSFVAAWTSYGQDGSGSGVHAQRYDGAGAPRGGEFRVNESTLNGQQAPSVAADAAGGFVVAWQSYGADGSGDAILARRFASSGAARGGEFQVNTATQFSQYFPDVSAGVDGGFVVAWHSYVAGGPSVNVYAQRHDSSGAPLGGEFLVNTWATADQHFPSVSLGPGGFVVAWQSYAQDGDSAGIFAQRFAGRAVIYHDTLQSPLTIPDNNATGITDLIDIPDLGSIDDLDVELGIRHGFVGDLRITLTHLDTGTSVTLVDRPGSPPDPDGCSGDDLRATLDDEAQNPVEDECAATPPAIAGRLRPSGLLGDFDGEQITGQWQLRVSDLQSPDVGLLESWALVAELTRPTPTPTVTATRTPTSTPTPTLPPVMEPPLRAENSAVKDVRALHPERGELWVGTPSGLLCWLDPTGPKPELMSFNPSNSGLPAWDITDLDRTHDGNLWAATSENGLASYDSVAWRYHNVDTSTGAGGQAGLLSDRVTALAVDRRWVVEGENVLAVEIHQANATSSDISFDLEFSGTLPAGGQSVLVPKGSVWSYLDDGSDQGTGWRMPGFDDAAWASGPAQLGYGDGGEATVVGFGPDANNKFVTTYFRRRFAVAAPAAFKSLSLALLRDDGAVVYLNGREVARSNMPPGAITSTTFAAGIVEGASESVFLDLPVGPATAAELWAGLQDPLAIAVYDGMAWTSTLVPAIARGASDQITGLAVDAEGVLWAATAQSGGFSFDGAQFNFFGGSENLPSSLGTVTVDLLDRVWFGSDFSGVRRLDGAPPFQDIAAGLPLSNVASLATGPDGTVWCMPDNNTGRGASPVPVYFDEQAQGWRSPPGITLPSTALLSETAIGPDGLVWIGSANTGSFGIAGFDARRRGGASLVTLTQGPGPRCSDVPSIVLDAGRSIWIACTQEGISRYDGVTWTAFNSSNTAGITSDAITSIAVEPPDTLWFGTAGGGVLRRQDGVFTALTTNNGLASNSIQAVAVAPDGTRWFATGGGNGVSRLQGSTFKTYSTSNGMLSNDVRSIGTEPGPGGGAWFATPVGLSRYNGYSLDTFTHYRSGSIQPGDFEQGGFPDQFTEVRVAPDGTVWAGTFGQGAVYFKAGVWRGLDSASDGLPADRIRAIAFDPDGATWLGVTDASQTGAFLVKWAHGEILDRITSENGLPAGAIQDIVFDPRPTGQLWVGTSAAGMLTLHASENNPVVLEQPAPEDIGCSSVQLRWSRFRGDGFAGYRVLRASGGFVGVEGSSWSLAAALVALAFAGVLFRGRPRRLAAAACVLLAAFGAVASGRDDFTAIQTMDLRSQRAYTDPTAQDGQNYRYRVDVLLSGGRNPLRGLPVLVRTGGIVPAAPELGFLSASSSDVHLLWPAPQTQGQCPATRFELEVRQQEGPFQVLASNLPPTAEDDHQHSPLAASTRYRYRLRAFNANGASAYSPTVDVTTAPSPPTRGECQPPAPVRLRARALGSDRIALSWADPARRFGCPQEGVNVYRVEARAEVLAARVGPGETRVQEARRKPATTYTYVVRAIRGGLESEPSVPAEVTTPAGSVRVFVPGDRATVRTGLTAARGSSVRVAAVLGEVRFNSILDFGSLVGPVGFDRVNFLTQWPDDAAVPDPLRAIGDGHAGLLALIDGQPLFVGTELIRVSNLGGEVRLGINDFTTTDPEHLANTGGFVVDVSLP